MIVNFRRVKTDDKEILGTSVTLINFLTFSSGKNLYTLYDKPRSLGVIKNDWKSAVSG